jgi:hypothetical protein
MIENGPDKVLISHPVMIDVENVEDYSRELAAKEYSADQKIRDLLPKVREHEKAEKHNVLPLMEPNIFEHFDSMVIVPMGSFFFNN